MKALSLVRPWSQLVLHAGKDIENRTWSTKHRGPLLVHGSKGYAGTGESVRAVMADPSYGATLAGALRDGLAIGQGAPTGYLGVVQVHGVCDVSLYETEVVCACGPWAMPGQCHWQLADPRPFAEPVPAGGQLGLWEPKGPAREAVHTALRGIA